MGLQPRGLPRSCLRIVQPRVQLGQIWVTPSDLPCNQVPSVPPLVPLLAISAEVSAGGSAAATDLALVAGFVHQDLAAETTCQTAETTYPTVEIVRARAIGLGSAIAPRSGT